MWQKSGICGCSITKCSVRVPYLFNNNEYFVFLMPKIRFWFICCHQLPYYPISLMLIFQVFNQGLYKLPWVVQPCRLFFYKPFLISNLRVKEKALSHIFVIRIILMLFTYYFSSNYMQAF